MQKQPRRVARDMAEGFGVAVIGWAREVGWGDVASAAVDDKARGRGAWWGHFVELYFYCLIFNS